MDDNAQWPEAAEKFFIDLCYEESNRRMGPPQSDKRNWSKIELKMIAEHGKAYRCDRLKQKWHRLKSATKIFQGLTEATGFGWDHENNTVSAEDEVWDSYIQKVPDAKRFKKHGLANYDKLSEMFAGKSATGALAMGPNDVAAFSKATGSARKEKVRTENTFDREYKLLHTARGTILCSGWRVS